MNVSIDTMVECTLENPDDFLKVRETLTRMVPRKDKTLYQSCHIPYQKIDILLAF